MATQMRTAKTAPAVPKTEREIRAKVRELEANRTSWQAGYPEMMDEARKRDIKAENSDPMRPHVGPEQDKAKARYYFELHRVSALITALEWALGQVEL